MSRWHFRTMTCISIIRLAQFPLSLHFGLSVLVFFLNLVHTLWIVIQHLISPHASHGTPAKTHGPPKRLSHAGPIPSRDQFDVHLSIVFKPRYKDYKSEDIASQSCREGQNTDGSSAFARHDQTHEMKAVRDFPRFEIHPSARPGTDHPPGACTVPRA